MLPNAAGTYLYKNWSPGSQEVLNYSWIYENVFDTDELRVIAFIQDEQTKEIYQAAMDKSDWLTSIGKKEIIPQELNFMIYPNPAEECAIILFNQHLDNDCQIEVYSMSGVLILTQKIEPGVKETRLNLLGLSHGLYFIRIFDSYNNYSILKMIKN